MLEKAPKKVVFMHVPKMAGTSAKEYLIACVGSRKSGNSVTLTDSFLNEDVSEQRYRQAERAKFVNGHFSWKVFENINKEDAVTFTTIGPAAERLWSLFFTLRATRPKLIRPHMADVYQWAREMSPEDFYKLSDERIRYQSNNAVVRQLGGSFDEQPETKQGWERLLNSAKENLQKFDFVCFKETFDNDFARVLSAAHLPTILPIGNRNVTQDASFDKSSKQAARKNFLLTARETIEPLTCWDQKLFEFARSERDAGRL